MPLPSARIALTVLLPALLGARAPEAEADHPGQRGDLIPREREIAQIAWTYFENNFQAQTCLVNAVDNYPSTTMWDTASYLGALVAARELGLIEVRDFDWRVGCLLDTLASLPLFEGVLPNKAYDTRTAQAVAYDNSPGETGVSATDLGRLLIWLRIVAERYPQHAPAVYAVLDTWDFCPVIDRCGTMFGATRDGGSTAWLQEGRLGYEEYAAKGYQLWGFKTDLASNVEPYEVARIHGVDIPYDPRDPRILGAHNYVVTESYTLDGIEFNWDRADDRTSDDATHTDTDAAAFAQRVYDVQAERNRITGILTARSEHQLDTAPWFVYDTIFSDGYPWNTLSPDGRYLPASAAVSVKAAVTMWALWDTSYSALLFNSMMRQLEPTRGFYEGVYELSGKTIDAITANNNGIILEALLYKVQGKLLRRADEGAVQWPTGATPELRTRCLLAGHQRSPCGAPGEP